MPVLKNKETRNKIRHDFFLDISKRGEKISASVKILRKISGMDQNNFAKFIGISISALRRIEQENGNVNISTLLKILDKFNLELRVFSKQ